jgi:uncharacterized membrane protein (DUF4010 family)
MKYRELIIAATILILALTVWPTIYSYHVVPMGISSVMVKINRVTGKAHIMQYVQE